MSGPQIIQTDNQITIEDSPFSASLPPDVLNQITINDTNFVVEPITVTNSITPVDEPAVTLSVITTDNVAQAPEIINAVSITQTDYIVDVIAEGVQNIAQSFEYTVEVLGGGNGGADHITISNINALAARYDMDFANAVTNARFMQALEGWTFSGDAGQRFDRDVADVPIDCPYQYVARFSTQYAVYSGRRLPIVKNESVFAEAVCATPSASAPDITLKVRFYNRLGALLETKTVANLVKTTDWTRIKGEVTSTYASATQAELVLEIDTATNTYTSSKRWYFTNARMHSGAVAENANARITVEETVRADADTALATLITTISTEVDGALATITEFAESVDGIMAQWGVQVNVGGVITGLIKLSADENYSVVKIQADKFIISNSAGDEGDAPFELVGGITYIKEAVIPTLTVDKLLVANFGSNLIINPDADENASGWRINARATTTSLVFSRSTTYANSGEASFKIEDNSTHGTMAGARAISVKAGEILAWSIWIRGSSASTNGLYLRVYELTSKPSTNFVGDTANSLTNVTNATSYTDLVTGDGAIPNTWTYYQGTYTVPAGVKYVSFSVGNWTASTADLYFDDVRFRRQLQGVIIEDGTITGTKIAANTITAANIAAGTITATEIAADSITVDQLNVVNFGSNLIANPDAEENLARWRAIHRATTTSLVLTRDLTEQNNGAASFKIADNSTHGTMYGARAIAVKPGWVLAWSVWIKGSTSSTNGLYVRMYESTSKPSTNFVGSTANSLTGVDNNTSISNLVTADSAIPNVWTYYSGNYTVPAGVTYITFAVGNWTASTADLYFDDVRVRRQIDTITFEDGSVTGLKIAGTTITASNIANSTITASQIANTTITASQIANSTITGGKIAGTTITASNIVNGTITATQISDATITNAKIVDSTITGGKIAAGTITASNIAAGTITATEIAADSITVDQLTIAHFGSNLIANPDAEENLARWRAVQRATTTSLVLSRDTSQQLSGAASFKIADNSTHGTMYGARAVAVKPGWVLAWSVWIKGSSASAAGLYIRAFELTSKPSTNFVGSTTNSLTGVDNNTSTTDLITANSAIPNTWTYYNGNYTVPAGVLYVTFAVGNYTASTADLYFDDVRFRRQLDTITFEDGSVTGLKILDATITGSKIANTTIAASNIINSTITATQIANSTITGGKIAGTTITASNITAATITATEIANSTITATQIANSTITGGKIAGTTITASNIVNATITATQIANSTITGALIASSTITGSNIAAGTITAANIAAGTITASEIAADSITVDNLTLVDFGSNLIVNPNAEANAAGWRAVARATTTSLVLTRDTTQQNNGTASFKIADNSTHGTMYGARAFAVKPGWILAWNVWIKGSTSSTNGLYIRMHELNAKPASNFVGDTANSLSNVDLATSTTDLITANSAVPNIWTYYSGTYTVPAGITYVTFSVGNWTASTADLYFDDVRVRRQIDTITFEDGAVTGGKIAGTTITASNIANTTITATQIANSTITGGKIANTTITASNILGGTITGTEIASATITGSHIANTTISNSNIVNSTITGGKIAANTITAANITAGTITATEIAANTITSAQIAAGTITATEIAADSITVDKLVVANFGSNLIINPDAEENLAGWRIVARATTTSLAFTRDTTTVNGGTASFKLADNSTHGSFAGSRAFAVKAGQILAWSVWINGSGASAAGLYIRMYELTSAPSTRFVGSTSNSLTSVDASTSTTELVTADSAIPNTWTYYEGTYTVPAGVKYATFAIGNWTASTVDLYFDDVRVRRQIDAVTIEDGVITNAKLVNATITGAKIANTTIAASNIVNSTITATQIANSTITATQIANSTITGGKIAGTTITASNITAATITATEIANSTITGGKIAGTTITASNIVNGTITATQISDATITNAKIVDGTITGAKIAANTITASNIAAGTITASEIAADSITVDQLNIVNFGSNLIANPDAEIDVARWRIIARATTTSLVFTRDTTQQNSGEASFKIADNSTHGSVLGARAIAVKPGWILSWSVWIKGSTSSTNGLYIRMYELTSAPTTKFVGSTLNSLTGVDNNTSVTELITGDSAISNSWTYYSGTYTVPASVKYISFGIGNWTASTADLYFDDVRVRRQLDTITFEDGAVTGGKIASATITASNITNSTITATQIANSTITGGKIAGTTITASNITAATITATEIANSTITATQISNSTITGGKIAGTTITASNITNATITTTQIAASTITGGNIAGTTIAASNIVNSTITATQIANSTITGGKIAAATITDSNIVGGTITGASIAANTITAANIAAGTITASEIAADSITVDQLTLADYGSNLIRNPDAEANIAGWRAVARATTTSLVLSRDVTQQNTGEASFKIADNSTHGTMYGARAFAVKPGWILAWSVWIKGATASTNGLYIRTHELTSKPATNFVGSTLNSLSGVDAATSTTDLVTADSAISNSWTYYSGTYTVPAGVQYITFSIGNWTASTTDLYFDDVRVRRQLDTITFENGAVTGGKIASATITASNITAATITATEIANSTITATQIANSTITGGKIAGTTITASNITNATITTTQIANSTITGSNIAGTTITASNIANTTITASQIANSTITATQISNSTITGGKIAGTTITASNIVAGTITGTEIAAATIAASNIINSTITGGKIASATITGSNIAGGTITDSNILGGTITGASIAAGTITASNISAGTITASEIAADSITVDQLNFVNFGSNLIANSDAETNIAGWRAVQRATTTSLVLSRDVTQQNNGAASFKIADNSTHGTMYGARAIAVKPGWVLAWSVWIKGSSASAAGLYIRMQELTSAPTTRFVGSTGNSLTNVDNATSTTDLVTASSAIPSSWTYYSGNYTVPAGVLYITFSVGNWTASTADLYFDDARVRRQLDTLTFEDGAITGGKIANVTITAANITSGTITATEIANSTITGGKIAGTTITASNIQNATITTTQIANSTITGGNIAGTTITASNIANTTITASQIANSTITATQITNSTITGGKIAGTTITASNIVAGTITATEILNSTITGGKIAAATITGSNIAGSTITDSNILGGTITGASIAAGTITAANIAAGTITASEIAADSITVDQLNIVNFGSNLISNPDAEDNLARWRAVARATTTSLVLTRDTTQQNSGEASFKIADNSTHGTVYGARAIAVKAGWILSWSVWVKGSSASTNGLYIRMYELTSAPTTKFVGSTLNSLPNVDNATSTTDLTTANGAVPSSWTYYSGTYTVPASVKYITFGVGIWTASTTDLYFDDVRVRRQLDTITFEDGAVTGGKIASATITASNITGGTITATEIANSTITATQIANSTITGGKIAGTTITASNITNATITTTQIANSTITGGNIAGTTITASNIVSSTITATQISNSTITGGKIANTTITGANIVNATITATQIAAGTITATEIASNTITATQIAAGTITATEIAVNAITASKIYLTDNSNLLQDVDFADSSYWGLQSGSYDTTAETTTTLGIKKSVKTPTGNGTTSQSTTNTAVVAVGQYSPIEAGKLYRITVQLLVKNGFTGICGIVVNWYKQDGTTSASTSNSSRWGVDYRTTARTGGDAVQTIDGQITAPTDAYYGRYYLQVVWSTTLNNAQYTLAGAPRFCRATSAELIVDGTITGAKIAANTITASNITAATITATEIAASTITGAKIAATTIAAGNIVSGTITTTQIAATTIVAGNIASSTITATQIAASTITGAKIAANTITASNIAAGTITATEIAAGTITAANISAGSITAAEIAVDSITVDKLTFVNFSSNLIRNPDAEVDLADWTETHRSGSALVLSRDTTNQNSGAASFKIADNGANGSFYGARAFAVKAGEKLAWSIWIDGSSASANGLYIRMIEKNAKPTARYLGQSVLTDVDNAYTSVTDLITGNSAIPSSWTYYSGTYTVPAGIKYVTFSVANWTTSTADLYFDDVRVRRVLDTITIDDDAITNAKILASTITGAKIAGTTITASNIVSATITATQIANSTITGGKIAGTTITASNITNSTITATQIANATITATQIANSTITGGKIAGTTITASNITAATITATEIANSTITGGKIANTTIAAGNIVSSTITATQIANSTITGGKIAGTTITDSNIVGGTITGASIAANTITASNIVAGTITSNELSVGSITASRLSLIGGNNFVLDPEFEDTSYWNLAGSFTYDTSTEVTAYNAVRGVKTPVGNGTTSQSTTRASIAGANNFFPVDEGTYYYTVIPYFLKAGFTGRPSMEIWWKDATRADISTTVVTTVFNDYRSSAFAGPSAASAFNGEALAPTNAVYAQFRLRVDWSTTLNNAQYCIFFKPYFTSQIDASRLTDNSIPSVKIMAGTIDDSRMTPYTLTNQSIASGTITATEIANGTITGTKIASSTITGSNIASTTVAAGNIVSSTITATQIANTTITGAKMVSNTVTATQIAASTITATEIANTTITGAKMVNGTVTTTQIASTTIVAGNIANSTITATQIANTTITGAKMVSNTVTATQIAAATITATEIANATITGGKIANNTITAANLAAGTITASELAANSVSASKLSISSGANIVRDENFVDATYWSIPGSWSVDTASADVLTNMNLDAAVKTVAGNGTTSQGTTETSITSDYYNHVEPGRSYRVFAITYVRSGFTGLIRVIVNWFKRDKTTSASTVNAVINGTDYRTVAASSGTYGTLDGIVTAPSDATYASYRLQVVWSTTLNNAQYAYFGFPSFSRAISADLIVAGTITTTEIAASTITGSNIAATTIAAGNIVSSTITATQIANTTITGGKIVTNTITATQIAASTITATEIANTTITGAKMVSGTVTTTQIASTTIVAGNIANSTITATQIANTTITGAKMVSNTVTATQIAASTITATEIVNATITGAKIANNTITAANLAAGTITATEISDGSITTAKIAKEAATASKVSLQNTSNLMLDSNIEDISYWRRITAGSATEVANGGLGTIVALNSTDSDAFGTTNVLNISGTTSETWFESALIKVYPGETYYAAGSIDMSATGHNTSIYIRQYAYDKSHVAYSPTLVGDSASTSVRSGSAIFTIPSNVHYVTFLLVRRSGGVSGTNNYFGGLILRKTASIELLVDASITGAKIVTNTITATQIAPSTITATEIANTTITGGKIVTNTITATQIAPSTITATEIANTTITGAKMVNGTVTTTQIASTTIVAGNIANSTITATQIANTTITGGKIVTNTITATQIANSTITATQIANSTITAAKIASGTITGTEISSSAALTVASVVTTSTITVDGGSSGDTIIAGSNIEIGNGRSGDGYAYIDLKGDTTYSDYGLRIIRNNTGANATSQIAHRGTGAMTILTQEAAAIVLSTAGVARLTVGSGGGVTIDSLTLTSGLTGANIASTTIAAGNIVNATITTTQIAATTIVAGNIANSTITATQIANTTITGGKIVTNTITATQIAPSTITATEIANTTITGGKIAATTITGSNLVNNTITSTQIAVAGVTASCHYVSNFANLALDSLFADTSYWTYAASWTLDTSTDCTTTLNIPSGLKTPTGNGTTSQSSTDTGVASTGYVQIEPGAVYRVKCDTFSKTGFTGMLRIVITWLKQNKSTAATPSNDTITIIDYRTSAAGADTVNVLDTRVTAPTDATWARYRCQVVWSTTLNNAQYGIFAAPRLERCTTDALSGDDYLLKATAAAANTTVSVPAGFAINGNIFIDNTTAAAVTGGIKIGTASGGTQVVVAQAVAANDLLHITDANIVKRIFSKSSAQTLYIQAVTAWNGCTVNITIPIKKVF